MIFPTRLEVINKLQECNELDKQATKSFMTEWLNSIGTDTDKIINDMESYSLYVSKS